MKTLTVFTPAYNRAHLLPRLYESLKRQTLKDFEWLIIDDGSSDNTREVVGDFKKEGLVEIRYIYQENQGMHGAHNTAYKNITTVLNTCIDSDDYMPDDAVGKILKKWEEVKGDPTISGIVGLDEDMSGKILGTKFTTPSTTLEAFYENGGRGDKKLVYRTDVMKQYPEYPIFEGEKYVGLGYKYLLADKDYKLATLNEPLVIVDYQEGGSSNNMLRQYYRNPKGFAFLRREQMKLSKSWKRNAMDAVHYVSSSLLAGNKNFITESPKKLLTLAALPLGFLLSRYVAYKNQTKSESSEL